MTGTPRRVHGPAQVTNAAATKYTVPTGVKAWTRHIHVQNPSGSPVTFTLSIGADAAATRIFDAYSIPAGTTLDYWGRHTLEATQIVQALAGTTLILTLTIDVDEAIVGTPSA
jgi:hypothetical protein